ncbi:MAG: Cache 3/Cache 2 fusion domain-containing protein, partial [Chitinispirillaceae bacterium]|nr:Cache 3/Cache 2 fusion domain-containing protein [Chitinispirillaceae bacterium]
MRAIKNFSIKNKLIFAGSIVSIILGVILITISLWQNKKIEKIAEEETTQLAIKDLEHILEGVVSMVTSMQEILLQKVNYDLNVAREILSKNGNIKIDNQEVEWDAVNQFTKDTKKIKLGKFMVGNIWLGQNREMSNQSPIVDKIK